MDNPLVSVLINNFNYEEYLAAAIDSALGQTYDRVEVVVVDDGSTDNSKEVIECYGERIIPILKPNGGQASALNAGYYASHGEILLFLDSDDVLLPNIITQVVERFARNPKAVKCQFRLRVVDSEGNEQKGILPPARISQPSGDITRLLARQRSYAHPPTSGNVFKRTAIESLMPIPESSYRKGATAYLVYNVGIFGEIESIDSIGGLYRLHGTNITSDNPYLNGEKLQAHVEEDVCARIRQMELFSEVKGYNIPEIGWSDLTHIRSRVALKKLFPENYTYRGSLLSLCGRGCVASFLYPDIGYADRVLWLAWFLAMLVLPRGLAIKLVREATSENERSRLLKVILGKRGRQE